MAETFSDSTNKNGKTLMKLIALYGSATHQLSQNAIKRLATLGQKTFKYLGIIIRSDLNQADHVNYTLRKAWKALHFTMRILKKGNNNTKRLAYSALLRPILEYGVVCWDPQREGQISALIWVQKRAAKFENNINRSGWETLAQRRLIARICALFKTYTAARAWKAIGVRFLKPCYLSRDEHKRKIRNKKQNTYVGKYFFVNRTIKSWKQSPAGLLVSFPCKLNTFRSRVTECSYKQGYSGGD